MVIYGEYLFSENFIAGVLLLLLTAKLTGKRPGKFRLFAGAILCGISGFIIFLPLSGGWSALVRVLVGTACVVCTFGLKNLLRTTAIFMALTFLAGGAVIAMLLWQQELAISQQGIIYMEAVTYLRLMCMGILAFGLTYWFVKFVRRRNIGVASVSEVCVVIEGKSYRFRAFVDSGNCLREPIAGKPVVLLDQTGAAKLPFETWQIPERYRAIPYTAVGVAAGNLDGLRTDEIIFENKRIRGAYVAFYRGTFGDFEVLMNREFLEGGLLEHV